MWHTDNTLESHKQIAKQNLPAMETEGTLSRTISYIAHIISAQSHNDNPIARATWLLL